MGLTKTVDKTSVYGTEGFFYKINITFVKPEAMSVSEETETVSARVEEFFPSEVFYTLPSLEGSLTMVEEIEEDTGTKVVFYFDKVTIGDTASLSIEVSFLPETTEGDTFTNSAYLYLDDVLSGLGTASTVTYHQNQAYLLKEGPESQAAGSQISYQILHSNQGEETLTEYTLIDIMPSEVDATTVECKTDATVISSYSVLITTSEDTSVVVPVAEGLSGDSGLLDLTPYIPTGGRINSVNFYTAEVLPQGAVNEMILYGAIASTATVGSTISNTVRQTATSEVGDISNNADAKTLVIEGEIPPVESGMEQAITDVIESVALEEAGIYGILDAEGAKIQKAVALDLSQEDLLAVNDSVRSMVETLSALEVVLVEKCTILLG